jgi:hypothetical protein
MEPELIRRAEQAYLGALLAGPNRSVPRIAIDNPDSGLSGLMSAADFHDPVHQAIFAAFARQSASTNAGGPAEWLGRLRDLLERIVSGKARSAAAYMAELPGLCPDPANLHAYAAIVAEASQHRADRARAQAAEQAAHEDPTLASAGTWLDSQGPATRSASRHQPAQAHRDADPSAGPARVAGASSPVSASRGREVGLAPHTDRLSRALRASAHRMTRAGQERDHEPGESVVDDLTESVKREHLEDRVLASLMKHPADGLAVIEWLPAEAFSTAPHRDLYDLIRQRLAVARPVDPLIIAWDASQLPNLSPSAEEYGGAAFLTQVALQISALDPAPGTAEILGRTLWAEHILTNALGQEWHTDPERVRQLAKLAAEDPGLHQEPAAGVTEQTASAGLVESALPPEADPVAEPVPEQQKEGPAPEIPQAPAPVVGATAVDAVPSALAQSPVLPAQVPAVVPPPVQVQQPPEPASGGPALRM